ncbi:MAG: hypothetical protein M3R38_01660 [Actinomycetota bacterium]|nr:hypothetical protein [Actinomycetota bacterium]
MIYERLKLMREILADKGSIYIHLDPTMSHRVKIIMDEVFGPSNFRSEIVWRRSNSHNKLTGQYGPIHDSILYYTKGDEYTFHPGTTPFSSGYIRSRFKYEDHRGIYQPNYLTGPGRRAGESGKPWRGFDPTSKGRHWAIPRSLIRLLDLDVSGMSTHAVLDLLLENDLLVIPKKVGGQPMYKQYLTEGIPYQDVWGYLPNSHGYLYGTEECLDQDIKWLEQEDEKLGFATQKPEGLLRRIIRTSSNPGDLVADFFYGSGTTLAAAEKLGRRWLGCDLGRWGVHVSRKRLLGIPDCKPFEVMNLGHYERQFWQGAAFGGGREVSERTLYEYIAFVLKLYGAQPISGSSYLHGRKGGAVVHVGSVDSPVTIHEVARALEECSAFDQKELHVLGWEWEMGLAGPNAAGSGGTPGGPMQEEARRLGIKLLLLQIPREVMEQQAVDRGDIRFFELAYLEVAMSTPNGPRSLRVMLEDFVVPNTELIPEEVREKVEKWSDYVDYWAVDWDFRNDSFTQGWVAYRTRRDRRLPLTSDSHTYEEPGTYRVAVKAIDIFGNDTTRVVEAEVG